MCIFYVCSICMVREVYLLSHNLPHIVLSVISMVRENSFSIYYSIYYFLSSELNSQWQFYILYCKSSIVIMLLFTTHIILGSIVLGGRKGEHTLENYLYNLGKYVVYDLNFVVFQSISMTR